MNDPFRLEHKVALVTGAAQGLGRAIADTLAQFGARVMCTDLTAINDVPPGCSATKLDVTSEAQWEQVVAHTVATMSGLDILVNNAGILASGPFTDMDLGIKHAARVMRPGGSAGKGGSIVNMSSVAGINGSVLFGAYGTSKGAVRTMTKDAAIEFQALGYGIRVNSVHPAVINTDMGAAVFSDYAALTGSVEASKALIDQMTPMKRIGTPQEVANAVRYLASDASSYTTGAELVVDGGMVAG
jgi:3alpha(or 20beta)-hydroxysteroid dehydrogenase